jgi:hypothetical protein
MAVSGGFFFQDGRKSLGEELKRRRGNAYH